MSQGWIRRGTNSRGLTIVELLVTVAVLAILAAVLLPALGAAREGSRRTQCMHQLRQVGVALHGHHGARRKLPAGWNRALGSESAYGWAVQILPFLEEQQLRRDVKNSRPIACESNAAAREATLPKFLCPSDITIAKFTLYRSDDDDVLIEELVELPSASYIGVFGTVDPDEDGVLTPMGDGAFGEAQRLSFRHFNRGLSKTMIVGERTMSRLPATWLGVDFRGDDASCRLIGIAQTSPNSFYSEDDPDSLEECEFESRHHGGANFLWADGHVELVSDEIESKAYRELARIFAS